MPSNQEIINKAVEQVIETNEPIDLLLISKSLDEINGEDIGADKDYGMHYNYLFIGMSGQKMVDQMNSNWRATDAQFLAHHDAINLRIKSNQIKEIKVENGIAYYTLDGENWQSLQAGWGKITGDINQQSDLKAILDDKVGITPFNDLLAQVGSNSNSIITLVGNVDTLSSSINSLYSQVNGNDGILIRLGQAEQLLSRKITSDDVLQIRAVNGTALEFTMDGENWMPVSSAGQVEWGDITGDIQNQSDIQLLLNNLYASFDELTASVEEAVNLTEEHLANKNNPHGVTAEQVGLGNVDNTSDSEKPLSVKQSEAVADMLAGNTAAINETINETKEELENKITNVGFLSLSKAEYEALETKNSTTLYWINDL